MIAGVSSLRRLDESGSPNQLTIEQLAAASGMSVRNIRAHQARGLLASPEVRLRVGYYGPEHVAQLRLIRELQDDGFNLNGIKRLLADTQGTAERLLRFKQAPSAPIGSERAEMLTITELAERFRVSGISLNGALAILEELQRYCDSISREFLKLFLGEVWKPFERANMPPEQWPEVEQAIERLRPVASEALMSVFQQRMSAQVEAAFGEITRGLSEPRNR
jgi:DNA-binding transcriptional MerR regulator